MNGRGSRVLTWRVGMWVGWCLGFAAGFALAAWVFVNLLAAHADAWRDETWAARAFPILAVAESEDIYAWAGQRHGIRRSLLACIAGRESGHDASAVNRRSGATGLFQFLWSTWANVAPLAGWGGYDRTDAWANADTAAFLMASPRLGGLNHWRATAGGC